MACGNECSGLVLNSEVDCGIQCPPSSWCCFSLPGCFLKTALEYTWPESKDVFSGVSKVRFMFLGKKKFGLLENVTLGSSRRGSVVYESD